MTLQNYGDSSHVHLRLDGDISQVARIQSGNHFVPAEAERSVPVEVRPVDETVTGTLVVSTGYGANERVVTVAVNPPVQREKSVDVDEQRASGRAASDPGKTVRTVVSDLQREGALPVVGLGALAVVLALAIGIVVDSPLALVGSVLITVGVAAALVFALR